MAGKIINNRPEGQATQTDREMRRKSDGDSLFCSDRIIKNINQLLRLQPWLWGLIFKRILIHSVADQRLVGWNPNLGIFICIYTNLSKQGCKSVTLKALALSRIVVYNERYNNYSLFYCANNAIKYFNYSPNKPQLFFFSKSSCTLLNVTCCLIVLSYNSSAECWWCLKLWISRDKTESRLSR